MTARKPRPIWLVESQWPDGGGGRAMTCAYCRMEAAAKDLKVVYFGMHGQHVHASPCPVEAENHIRDYRRAEFYAARASQPEGRK